MTNPITLAAVLLIAFPASAQTVAPGNSPALMAPEPEADETTAVPTPVPHRPYRFRVEFAEGLSRPTDVLKYDNKQYGQNETMSNVDVLVALEVSGAYYPVDYFGMRPSLAFILEAGSLLAPLGSSKAGADGLGAIAPGLSLDFVSDRRGLVRFFASPGLRYFLAQYGDAMSSTRLQWDASGVGFELALGTEFSFGARRAKGISIGLVLQSAKLGVSSRPAQPPAGAPSINTLDMSAVYVRGGFQMGI